jgi:hypothetical protein
MGAGVAEEEPDGVAGDEAAAPAGGTGAPAPGLDLPDFWQEATSRAAARINVNGSHLLTIPCTTPCRIRQTSGSPPSPGMQKSLATLQNPRPVIL